jgi:hypothetical protein
MQKTWEKPQLVILVRSRPEEAILQTCKNSNTAGGDPITTAWYCLKDYATDVCVLPCSDTVGS